MTSHAHLGFCAARSAGLGHGAPRSSRLGRSRERLGHCKLVCGYAPLESILTSPLLLVVERTSSSLFAGCSLLPALALLRLLIRLRRLQDIFSYNVEQANGTYLRRIAVPASFSVLDITNRRIHIGFS